MAKKQNLPAKVEPTETLPVNLLAGMADFAGQGFENQTREDITIPTIYLLQALSPQLESIAGAKAGLMLNSVTEELNSELVAVPACTSHEFVEYVPRKAGGGFVGVHEPKSAVVAAAKASAAGFGQYFTPNGNELTEFFSMFLVLCDETQPLGMAVMRFKSTKIKVYRAFNTRLQICQIPRPDGKGRFTPALFCHTIRISTKKEKNAHGEFFNYVLQSAVENNTVKSLIAVHDPRSQMAQECRKLVTENKIVASYEEPEHVREPGEDDDNGVF